MVIQRMMAVLGVNVKELMDSFSYTAEAGVEHVVKLLITLQACRGRL